MRFASLCLFILVLLVPGRARALGEDFIEMPKPEAGEYVLSSGVGSPGKGRHWGRPAMIRHLLLVAKEWRRRHPELPRLRIGDISKFGGGHFPPHKTHQDGLAVDIFTSPKNICHINYPDQTQTLELAELFVSFGAKQILYNHPDVIAKVAVMRKWPKHHNHFHVVVDPRKVPAEGEPIIVPGKASGGGAWVGRRRVQDDGTGLELRWRVLGAKASVIGAQVFFDDLEDGALLHESGVFKPKG